MTRLDRLPQEAASVDKPIATLTKTTRILIVDDDEEVRWLLSQALEREGFCSLEACDGNEMLSLLQKVAVDLILLDVMLPGKDGFTLCRELRAENKATPVILVTARGDELDRVAGLELGADDYVSKPFSSRELIARINAVLRRSSQVAHNDEPRSHRYAKFGTWKLDVVQRELLSADDCIVSLSTTEFDLLSLLVSRSQTVLSRDELLGTTKGRPALPFDRSVDVQVSRIRRKLGDDAKDPKLIKTVWGGGYIFTPNVVFE